MVDRINNNPYTNAYKNSSVKKTPDENAPKFLLGNEEEGVIFERQNDKKSTGKETSTGSDDAIKIAPKKDVVELQYLSDKSGKDKTEKDQIVKDGVIRETSFDLGLSLKKFVDGIKKFFSGIMKAVWYEDDAKEDYAKENEVKEENATKVSKSVSELKNESKTEITDPGKKDKLIRESISRKDNNEVIRLLTDNYSRVPARNTTLLTRYDKQGKIANIDGADEVRILTDKKGLKM